MLSTNYKLQYYMKVELGFFTPVENVKIRPTMGQED